MGLEVATYIPELVNTNPIGISDTVSEGDDHLRLLKKTILNSFPGFVGTGITPKFVTLTEDQINVLIDAAIKNIAQTIPGLWTFTADNIHQGNEVFENLITLEDNAGNVVAQTTTAALGALLVSNQGGTVDLKAGFRNPEEFAVIAAGTLSQAMEGQIARYTGAGGILTVPVLTAGTNIDLIQAGSGAAVLTQSGVTINWLDGSGTANTGNRTVAANSIVHLRYETASLVDVWGNGIS